VFAKILQVIFNCCNKTGELYLVLHRFLQD